jgi:hypothetical protein
VVVLATAGAAAAAVAPLSFAVDAVDVLAVALVAVALVPFSFTPCALSAEALEVGAAAWSDLVLLALTTLVGLLVAADAGEAPVAACSAAPAGTYLCTNALIRSMLASGPPALPRVLLVPWLLLVVLMLVWP